MLRKLLTTLSLAVLAAMLPAQADEKGQAVRPEVGKPLQEAIDLLKKRRGREAYGKAREANAVSGRSAYESLLVDQVLGQAAAAAGDASAAGRAFEAAAASSAASGAQKLQFLAASAGQYYVAKDYGKAADVSERYLRGGGNDRGIRQMYAQALFLGKNYAAAAKVLSAEVEADEKAGRAPTESELQLLLSSYHQQRDDAGYSRAMEKLVAYYPKKDYWVNVLQGVAARPGFADKLAVDLARLKLDAGVMRTASEYVEAAQLVLQDGFPMEASKIIEQGYAAGLLGTGPEAERHKRLKDLTAKNLAEDKAALAQGDGGGAKDGKTLFNDGYNYVLHGKIDRGLSMMEEGLKLGTGFRRPEHAKLQMGHAYFVAGKKQKAIQVYKSVQGSDGAQSIARLWVIRLAKNGA